MLIQLKNILCNSLQFYSTNVQSCRNNYKLMVVLFLLMKIPLKVLF